MDREAVDAGHEQNGAFYQGLSQALVAHAKAVFHLNQRKPDGSTLREHLQAVERSTKRRPPELDVPALPQACAGVWQIFLELHSRRAQGGFGPAALDEARLLNWQQLHAARLSPWEIECIFALDNAWLASTAEANSPAKKPGTTA